MVSSILSCSASSSSLAISSDISWPAVTCCMSVLTRVCQLRMLVSVQLWVYSWSRGTEMRSNQDPCCSWPPYDDQAKMTRPRLDKGGRLSVDLWWTRRLPWGPDHTFKPQNTEGCVVPWGRKLGPLRCGPQQCTDPGESMTKPCPASGGPQTRRCHPQCPWLKTRCQQEEKIEQINIKI